MRDWSDQSEVNPLRTVLLRDAGTAFGSERQIGREWRALHYSSPPDWEIARAEFEAFARLLEGLGVELVFLPGDSRLNLDSIYVRDSAVVSSRGIILCRMGKPGRRSEPATLEGAAADLDLEIAGCIGGEGTVEGGDVVWLDEKTIAVGLGYRTNLLGLAQLKRLLEGCYEEWIEVPLPHWRGPADVFHLMSMLSPVDRDLALVYSPLLPVPFRERLLELGFALVEVPDSEFESLACNVLTVRPRQCVMLAGNRETRRRLEKAGAEVHEYQGTQISIPGAGGPTCLTRPLRRSP